MLKYHFIVPVLYGTSQLGASDQQIFLPLPFIGVFTSPHTLPKEDK